MIYKQNSYANDNQPNRHKSPLKKKNLENLFKFFLSSVPIFPIFKICIINTKRIIIYDNDFCYAIYKMAWVMVGYGYDQVSQRNRETKCASYMRRLI